MLLCCINNSVKDYLKAWNWELHSFCIWGRILFKDTYALKQDHTACTPNPSKLKHQDLGWEWEIRQNLLFRSEYSDMIFPGQFFPLFSFSSCSHFYLRNIFVLYLKNEGYKKGACTLFDDLFFWKIGKYSIDLLKYTAPLSAAIGYDTNGKQLKQLNWFILNKSNFTYLLKENVRIHIFFQLFWNPAQILQQEEVAQ